ncbi:MAG: ribosome biogenesis GTPase YlqF [Negativicutes bacterium]|nr:ribosome biogenesis GTPase YlqF [Negativicutes bacterium]
MTGAGPFSLNWFPGHMAKARREIQAILKTVDIVVELLDARIPRSSANPMLAGLIADRPRVVVLNKTDLADQRATRLWVAYFAGQGLEACPVSCGDGRGIKELVRTVTETGLRRQAWLTARGVRPRTIKAMVAGIPNVGKSSLINRLAGRASARTADRPGVTRGHQLIRVGRELEIIDTPGVLWPRLSEPECAIRLAWTGAIRDQAVDSYQVAVRLADYLLAEHPQRLFERYGMEMGRAGDGQGCLQLIAIRRGMLRSGGRPDEEKAGQLLLGEFRSGKLGLYTLDSPGYEREVHDDEAAGG